MTKTELNHLVGRSVLVRSAQDQGTPETAVRGTIQVFDDPHDGTIVEVALDLPDLFTTRAHQRVLRLREAEVARLLSLDPNQPWEITIDDEVT